MDGNFDLSTQSGRAKAIRYLKEKKILTFFGFRPTLYLLDGLNSVFSQGQTNTDQAKVVQDLIKQGKNNGVKKMKITIDSKSGFDFSAPIEGVNIKAMVGSEGKITLDIEYA